MDEKQSVRWVSEFLALKGVDHDPWRMALLSKLVWFAVITDDPAKWTFQTAEEMRARVGADESLSVRAVRKKLQQLEDAKLIEATEGWQRRKRYRPNLKHPVVGEVYERFRSASHVVTARDSIRNHSSDAFGTTVPTGNCPPSNENQRATSSFGTTAPTHEPSIRNHSSDGRNHSSDARTENTTERITTTRARAREGDHPNNWRGFDDWLRQVFDQHGHALKIAYSQSLAMNLSELCEDRSEAQGYVRAALLNMGMDDAETGKIVRALQKRPHLDRYRDQLQAAASLPLAQSRVMTAADERAQSMALAEIYGGSRAD